LRLARRNVIINDPIRSGLAEPHGPHEEKSMSFRLCPIVIVWLGLFVPAYADEPTATQLLEQSQKALRAVQAIAYDAVYVSEGVAASVLPSQKGHVILARNNSRLLKIRADAWTSAPDGRLVLTSEMVSDGNTVASIDHRRQMYRELTGPGAGGEILRWHGIVVEQLLRGELYKSEIAGGTATYRDAETVDGIECYVIEAPNPEAPVVARWFISKKDLLPRRVIRTVGGQIGEGRADLTLNSLDPNPPINEKLFALVRPEGYTDRGTPLGPRTIRSPLEPQFLPIGSDAPDWSLRTSDGRSINLKELRGKVVLLSFWASWAHPCANALPGIQGFCEAYKDRPVATYIINTFEHRADPAKVLQPAGLSQALLLNGDDVASAYKVQGIPTFYLISPAGKVLFAEGGVLHVDSLKEMVDRALQGADSSDPPTAP
jgi:thiol-disulfide isomerase/thioredoxin/outer membrane lipoprotein-sorting protein